MSSAATVRLVLRPECSLGAITAALESRGFASGRSTVTLAPLVAGEPEMLMFAHHSDDVRVMYEFVPVVGMRTLAIRGSAAASWAAALAQVLPCLRDDQLAHLLASERQCDQLLGLYAIAELGIGALLPAVQALLDDRAPKVAAAARRTAERLFHAGPGDERRKS